MEGVYVYKHVNVLPFFTNSSKFETMVKAFLQIKFSLDLFISKQLLRLSTTSSGRGVVQWCRSKMSDMPENELRTLLSSHFYFLLRIIKPSKRNNKKGVKKANKIDK